MTNRERLLRLATRTANSLNKVLDELANEQIQVTIKTIDMKREKDTVARSHIYIAEDR